MRNKLTSMACASLTMMGVSATTDAATIAMDFTGNSGYVSYVFDLQNSPLGDSALTLTSANINGSVYNSSNYTLEIYDFEVTDMIVTDSAGNELSRLTFNGYFQTQNGTLDMVYYGDGITYTGSSYAYSSTVDSQGYADNMLYDQNSQFGLTAVSVNTVSPVPVPAAAWLFGAGLVGLAGVARRRA
jgi:hypothetical protein